MSPFSGARSDTGHPVRDCLVAVLFLLHMHVYLNQSLTFDSHLFQARYVAVKPCYNTLARIVDAIFLVCALAFTSTMGHAAPHERGEPRAR